MSARSHALGALQKIAGSPLVFRRREPQALPPRRALILLHGVGGNESNLLDLAAGVDDETLVVFPRGPLPIGADAFAWFRVGFTPTGPAIDAEQAEASRVALIDFVACVQREYAIDPAQTVIAGFSQGGIVSASVALSAPERVGAFAILSGRILPELALALAGKGRLRALRAFIGHGIDDATLPFAWAERSAALLDELQVGYVLHRYAAGHTVSAAMHADFQHWLRALA